MTAEVVYPGFITKLDIPPGRILAKASEAELESAVVVGFDKNGDFYFASSLAAGPEVLWLLKLAEKKLLEVGDD